MKNKLTKSLGFTYEDATPIFVVYLPNNIGHFTFHNLQLYDFLVLELKYLIKNVNMRTLSMICYGLF